MIMMAWAAARGTTEPKGNGSSWQRN